MKNILAEKWKRYNSLPNIVLAKVSGGAGGGAGGGVTTPCQISFWRKSL